MPKIRTNTTRGQRAPSWERHRHENDALGDRGLGRGGSGALKHHKRMDATHGDFGERMRKMGRNYYAHSGEMSKIRGFHQKHSTKSWTEHNPKREALLRDHIFGRIGKEEMEQKEAEAHGGVEVEGYDPLKPEESIGFDPKHPTRAPTGPEVHSRTGQVNYSSGAMEEPYALAATGLRATGVPIHEPTFEAHFDPRDPMRSKVGFAMGDDEVHVSVGGMTKMAKRDALNAAKVSGQKAKEAQQGMKSAGRSVKKALKHKLW